MATIEQQQWQWIHLIATDCFVTGYSVVCMDRRGIASRCRTLVVYASWPTTVMVCTRQKQSTAKGHLLLEIAMRSTEMIFLCQYYANGRNGRFSPEQNIHHRAPSTPSLVAMWRKRSRWHTEQRDDHSTSQINGTHKPRLMRFTQIPMAHLINHSELVATHIPLKFRFAVPLEFIAWTNTVHHRRLNSDHCAAKVRYRLD